MNHARLDSNCSCLQMQEVHLAVHDCLRPSARAYCIWIGQTRANVLAIQNSIYLPCHTRITQFLGNICFSSVYEITDLCVHCRLTMLVHLSLFTCIFFYTVHCRFVCLIDYSLVCVCGIGESAGLSGI